MTMPKTVRILVLDDHPIQCLQAKRLLEGTGVSTESPRIL